MRTTALAAVLALTLAPLSAQEQPPVLPTPGPPAAPPARPEPGPRPEPPPPAEPPGGRRGPRPLGIPLKVQVTISRFEGEKKTLSLPYSLLVNSPDSEWGERTSLRMGIDVPIRLGPAGVGPDGKPTASYQYRNVGTRIDCRSSRYQDRYFLDLTVEQSSLNNPSERASFVNPDIPVFRSFNSSFWGILRDGQSVTTVAAADPVSGESVRIEVSATAAR
jgi:hypothetical protein